MKCDRTPLDYARMAAEAIMYKFAPEELPPKGVLFYHQGVFLSGVQSLYTLSGEEKYFNYVKDYVDSVIGENGELQGIDYEADDENLAPLGKKALQMLDHKQATLLFYQLFDRTGDEKYSNAIKKAAESLYYWPVNLYGGYWHKLTEPNQMWMDGAYMCGPLSLKYAKRFGATLLRERAVKQIFIMNEHLKDEKTGLYFHGWDPTKLAPWADKELGLSPEIWGRAVGWYSVAILDVIELLPEGHPATEALAEIELDLLRSLQNYRRDGLWCEVLDKPTKDGNWVESSCSNLFIYSYAKAIRMGIAKKEEFEDILESAYEASIGLLYTDGGGHLVIDKVCEGTNIGEGSYEYYIGRKQIKNDLHGAGAFLLMACEMQKYRDYCK